MTTSGVQMAGVRGAGGVSGNARSVGRAGGGSSSFADMVSANLSAQKDGSSTQPRAERADGNYGRTDTVQKADPASNAVEANKAVEKEPAPDAGTKVKPEEECTDAGMQDASASEEDGALDTQFPKSLKLFKEAARLLEAQKLNELKQAVMDSMNIDEEELGKILEQLGVNMQELMQPQILQQVVVAVQGAGDPAVLLTNETAMNNLRELLAKAQELTAGKEQAAALADGAGEIRPDGQIPEDASQFEELLAEGQRQDTEPGKDVSAEPADESAADGTGTQTGEKTGFSFEAVKEGGQTRQNPSDSRGGAGDAKANAGSMAEQFLDLVANAASKDEVEFSQLSKGEQVRQVAQQILERVRVFVGEAQTSMEISLTPESLGKVTLNLVSRQGALTAHFTAQNQIAKEAIESQIVVLRENLESQGLKVEAIEVTVSNFDFTQNGGAAADNGGQGGRQRRRGVTFEEAVNAENGTGRMEAEEIAADMRERNGNQVDYTA